MDAKRAAVEYLKAYNDHLADEDAGHGKAASAITRRALAQFYGLEQRPTPHQDTSQIDALTAQLSTLAQSVIGPGTKFSNRRIC